MGELIMPWAGIEPAPLDFTIYGLALLTTKLSRLDINSTKKSSFSSTFHQSENTKNARHNSPPQHLTLKRMLRSCALNHERDSNPRPRTSQSAALTVELSWFVENSSAFWTPNTRARKVGTQNGSCTLAWWRTTQAAHILLPVSVLPLLALSTFSMLLIKNATLHFFWVHFC